MGSFLAALAMAAALAFPGSPPAAAAQDKAKVDLQESVAKAVACRREFGASWDPIVQDAMSNLQSYLEERDPTIPKVDLDVALAEPIATGRAMPSTKALRDGCRKARASGS